MSNEIKYEIYLECKLSQFYDDFHHVNFIFH
jgi:hypothetical protein